MEQELIAFIKGKKEEAEQEVEKVHAEYDQVIEQLQNERNEKLFGLAKDLEAFDHLLARYGVKEAQPEEQPKQETIYTVGA